MEGSAVLEDDLARGPGTAEGPGRAAKCESRFRTPQSRTSSRAVPMADRVGRELELLFQASAYQTEDDLVFGHPHTGERGVPASGCARGADAYHSSSMTAKEQLRERVEQLTEEEAAATLRPLDQRTDALTRLLDDAPPDDEPALPRRRRPCVRRWRRRGATKRSA